MNPAKRINLGFSLALLLVAGTGIIAYSATMRLAQVSAEVERAHDVLAVTERVITGLLDAESAQRGYVITGNATYLAPYRDASTRVTEGLTSLRALIGAEPELMRHVNRLAPLARQRLELTGTIIDVRTREGFAAGSELVHAGRGKETMDSVRAVAALLQTAEQQRLDAAVRRVDQVARFAQLTVASGSLLAFMVVIIGVARVRREFRVRRRAESALRESETLLKQFMDTLPIGAYVVDAEGRPSFANTTALSMLGSEALGSGTPLQLWRSGSPDPVPAAEMPLARALQGLAARTDDLEIRLAGRALPLEISAAPVYDSEGQVAYGIAAFSDITERKRNQAALRAAKEAAEHANDAKSDFLARMSHELRTPLNSIIGFANILLKKNAGLAERERTYLQRILDNGKNLLLLINDILDLSKIEAGKVVIEKELVDLGVLIEEVLQQWEGQLRSSSVHLERTVPDGTSPLFTDPARLRQVLINLVSNAVKFTERGSVRVEVEVATGTGRPRAIRVTDTGIGIAADRLEAIFDAFEQAETSTTRKYGGTGLGLPISRALCDLLGYGLTVTSTPGEGTEFVIRLEHARVPLGESGGSAEPTAAPLALVVDDDASVRTRLAHALEALDCRVVSAFSADQGVNLARALHPHLITLDLGLPDAGAWHALAELRAERALEEAEIVLLAHRDGPDGDGAGARVLCALDVLTKPVGAEQVEAVLQRQRQATRILLLAQDPQLRAALERMLHDQVDTLWPVSSLREAMTVLADDVAPDLVFIDLMLPGPDGFDLLSALRGDPRLEQIPAVLLVERTLSPDARARLAAGTAALLRDGVGAEPDLSGALARCLPYRHA